MKKLLTLSLTLIILLSFTAVANADLIWEPNNSFYQKHSGECTFVNRQYYANGPDGFVTLYTAPGAASYTAQYENGEKLWGEFQYGDWLCITNWEDNKEISGWVPLSELYLVYDYLSFEEEYSKYFQPYNNEFVDYDGPAEGIELYEYPDCSWPKYTLKADQQEWLDAMRGTAGSPSYFSHIYHGSNGDIWGFIGYLYAYRNFWVRLNNPTGTNLMNCFPEESVVENLIASGELTAPRPPVPPSTAYLPYILVGVVVTVTVLLLYIFYIRGRKVPPHPQS